MNDDGGLRPLPEVTWERISRATSRERGPDTWRAKVPGGWFVAVTSGSGSGVTFYPDPEHAWDGGSLP